MTGNLESLRGQLRRKSLRSPSTCKLIHTTARAGFTIVEVLVALSIIGLLLAVLIPAAQSVRATSRRSQCASQMREIGVALQAYESTHRQFPNTDFHYRLLPFLGHENIHALIPDVNWKSRGALPIWELLPADPIAMYICPSDARAPNAHVTNYGSSDYLGGMGLKVRTC